MKPISNFEGVKEAGGQIENLPVGAYVCEIRSCAEKGNRRGGSRLEILFDICEGEYKGWFMNDWRDQNREDKFWHGIVNQNIPDESSPKYDTQCGFFKRFVNRVEQSNPGYHWNWDEKTLVGKKIGVVFGEVERESQRGTRYMTTRADSVVSVEDVRTGKAKIPAPRMMDAAPAPAAPAFADPMDDLPF